MNLTDRIYFAVHAALTVLVCVRHEQVLHWPKFVAWNIAAMIAIVVLARKRDDGVGWQFAHDFLPAAVFFTSAFEETSFLCLAVVSGWQNSHLGAFENAVFGTSPALWLRQHVPHGATEILEFGYFAFYPMYPVAGVTYWAWRNRYGYENAFRTMTDALSIGYLFCYVTYIAWPTQSPLHAGSVRPVEHHGPFSWLVGLIQHNGGVHGNAFPSGHIMLAFVILVFVFRHSPRIAPWLLVANILMCLGAVYDGYHYASDVIAGAVLGTVVGMTYLRISERRSESRQVVRGVR